MNEFKSFEGRERAPLPRGEFVNLIALRRNDLASAGELRRSLPLTLAGILGEVPGARLTLRMLADADGVVDVAIAAAAGEDTSVVAAEVAAVLQPAAETAVTEPNPDTTQRWPLIADLNRGALGFATESTQPAVTSTRFVGTDEPATQLIEDLAAVPGQGLVVTLRALPQAREPRWEAQLSVITVADQPSLRLRAALRRRFPGLRVAGEPAGDGARLQVGPGELPQVFPIPVAGPDPLPGAYTGSPAPIAVNRSRGDAARAGAGLRIGQAVTNSGRPVPVELDVAERLRHIHVLGQTGTGKSSALAGMVRELAARSDGALIADPHGQLCERILAELPEEALDRVWVVRCGDVENPVPMNPLAESDPARRDIAIADLCATFQYLFDKNATGVVGPRFQERVGMTLRALAAVHGPRASLLDVPIAAADKEFMDAAVKQSQNRRLQAWWRIDKLERQSNEHGQLVAWVNSKFEAFSNTAAMRGILGSGADALDFADAMDEGRIILLDLSKAELGEAASRLLGFMYLSRVWNAALRRRRPDRPFTVVVDEAHTLIAGALINMLAEGRKFGLSVVLAHQFLDQLDADLRPAVDGNVATTLAFRCAAGDAGEIYKRFGGMVDSSVLVTLPDLAAITLRTAQPGPAQPHTVIIDHNRRITALSGPDLDERTARVLRRSRADLVDPYREATANAVAGACNVTAPPAGIVPPPARVRRIPRPAARPQSGFLDDWLQRHAAGGDQTGSQDPVEQCS